MCVIGVAISDARRLAARLAGGFALGAALVPAGVEEPSVAHVSCLTMRTRRMACPGSLPIEALKGESSCLSALADLHQKQSPISRQAYETVGSSIESEQKGQLTCTPAVRLNHLQLSTLPIRAHTHRQRAKSSHKYITNCACAAQQSVVWFTHEAPARSRCC